MGSHNIEQESFETALQLAKTFSASFQKIDPSPISMFEILIPTKLVSIQSKQMRVIPKEVLLAKYFINLSTLS